MIANMVVVKFLKIMSVDFQTMWQIVLVKAARLLSMVTMDFCHAAPLEMRIFPTLPLLKTHSSRA